MTTVPLPERPDLGQLRKQAKELHRATPGGTLADAQRTLARRYGFASWPRLQRHVEAINSRTWVYTEPAGAESPAARFLRLACLNFAEDTPDRWVEATRLRHQHPDLPATSLAVAAACADVPALQQHLAAGASAAKPAAPFDWPPLMYLAYARVEVSQADTLAAARLLLDAGADPNDGRFFLGLPTPFTVLTGALGGGEEDQPPHPHSIALARLLLEAGANPNDGQSLYNRMFTEQDDFAELLLEFGLGQGDGGPWRRLVPDLLGSPEELVRGLLHWAVTHDQRKRVALLAAHGVDVTSPLADGATPLEHALRNGHRKLAKQLHDLRAHEPKLNPMDAFIAAALAGDRAEVEATPPHVVEAARAARPGLVVWAAAHHRPEAVKLLVDNGFDVNARGRGDVPLEHPWQTALHTAIQVGDLEVVRLLLELGADPGLRDCRFDGDARSWAEHFDRTDVLDLLGP
ncbi:MULTISPECIES: ankyrin repeat domain-containing protein [unclassified Crossiella]|uniref:ankyrin repeat domain-containing protein n=1 Tax=unclassified Crossiella TaxID=2620835 RepID=UPI001FFF014A|nr:MULTISPECIES: ankyrin repeat domain-containing protein [unclassified Crossiella]MCK2244149.1 ankyrin repeat domain-containing protein [Crossiella sp. S99.2]MCK2257953.1 ankyrin repeat domain-containing protein [Crossiella sp. S99.1]